MNAQHLVQYEMARRSLRAAPRPVARRQRRLSLLKVALLAGAAVGAIIAFSSTGGQAMPTLDHQQNYLAAAGAWVFYNEAKKYLGTGDIDLLAATFRIGLYTSASNAATVTLSRHDQVTNEVSEANGYSSSGKALSGVTWTAGASASEFRFDATDSFWSANGGSIANIKYAVIFIEGASAGARKLLCQSTLSSSQFTLSAGNRLTIQYSANGIFELN